MSAERGDARGLNLGHTDQIIHEQAESEIFGSWVFLMSDAVLFALLFATYGVMLPATAGGRPRRANTSSFLPSLKPWRCSPAAYLRHGVGRNEARRIAQALLGWMGVTLILGVAFIGMELHDFVTMFGDGAYRLAAAIFRPFLDGCSAWVSRLLRHHLDAVMMVQVIRLGWTCASKSTSCGSACSAFLISSGSAIFSVVYLQG